MQHFFSVDDLPPCDPSHNLNTVKDPKAHSTNNSLFGFNYACPYDCIHTFYKTSVSTGGFNVAALTKFLDSSIYTSRFRAKYESCIPLATILCVLYLSFTWYL